ncbi:MAG: hypothetical protein J2P13_03720 [Acidobacteria bacterium]|nr:hypothetical protein [Acidobacteriota bacterium]
MKNLMLESKILPPEAKTAEAEAPSVPVGRVWRAAKGFIFWSYERGTVQYDVMVTLILLFVFFSPRLIEFRDRPVEHNPHSTGVVVDPDPQLPGGFIYKVDALAVPNGDDSAIRAALLRVIEPISGGVFISRYEKVKDNHGRLTLYKVWVQRE